MQSLSIRGIYLKFFLRFETVGNDFLKTGGGGCGGGGIEREGADGPIKILAQGGSRGTKVVGTVFFTVRRTFSEEENSF